MVRKKKRSPRKKAGRARVQQKDDKVDSLDPWAHPMERLLTLLLSLRLQSPLMATSRLAQDPRRLVSLHHTQVALQPLLTSRIDTVLPLAPKKHKKNLLLTLPLELRVSIYQLVLNTTEFDDETQSHVYEIEERRIQRSKNLALRSNNFTPINIRNQHFALLKTCRAVRQEIHSFVNLRYSFSFASPTALAKFALGPRANYDSSISKEVAETYGRRTLYHTSAGNLRVLRMAEGSVVFPGSGDAHITSVEQLMGMIVNSFKGAWRSQPLIPKSTGGGR
jgi:hypothetical protein